MRAVPCLVWSVGNMALAADVRQTPLIRFSRITHPRSTHAHTALVFPWHAFDVSASSSSRLLPALQFAINHPQLLSDALLLSLCSSLGQLIIYQTIKEFGALLYSTVMTTRQFVGILLSALVFGHALSGAQWIGAVLVFMALYWRTAGKSRGTMRSVHGDTMGSPSSSKSSLLPVYQPPMVQLR